MLVAESFDHKDDRQEPAGRLAEAQRQATEIMASFFQNSGHARSPARGGAGGRGGRRPGAEQGGLEIIDDDEQGDFVVPPCFSRLRPPPRSSPAYIAPAVHTTALHMTMSFMFVPTALSPLKGLHSCFSPLDGSLRGERAVTYSCADDCLTSPAAAAPSLALALTRFSPPSSFPKQGVPGVGGGWAGQADLGSNLRYAGRNAGEGGRQEGEAFPDLGGTGYRPRPPVLEPTPITRHVPASQRAFAVGGGDAAEEGFALSGDAERDADLAAAFGVEHEGDMAASRGEVPIYTTQAIKFARNNAQFTAGVERTLVYFAKSNSLRYSLTAMNRQKRKVVHEMAGHFGFDTQSFDRDPNRFFAFARRLGTVVGLVEGPGPRSQQVFLHCLAFEVRGWRAWTAIQTDFLLDILTPAGVSPPLPRSWPLASHVRLRPLSHQSQVHAAVQAGWQGHPGALSTAERGSG